LTHWCGVERVVMRTSHIQVYSTTLTPALGCGSSRKCEFKLLPPRKPQARRARGYPMPWRSLPIREQQQPEDEQAKRDHRNAKGCAVDCGFYGLCCHRCDPRSDEQQDGQHDARMSAEKN